MSDLIPLLYLLLGSVVGGIVKYIVDQYKERPRWTAVPTECSFKRPDKNGLKIEVEYLFINNGRRKVSIPFAFLTIASPKFF